MKTLMIATVAGLAGVATASPFGISERATAEHTATQVRGGTLTTTVTLDDVMSYGGIDDPSNYFNTLNLGAGTHIVGIGYDVEVTAYSPSWQSEVTVAFENSDYSGGVYLTPGISVNESGTGSYSSGGIVDLIGLELDFFLNDDGLLLLQVFESWNDGLAPDGMISGTLTIQYVPTPGALAVLGLGGLVAGRRRR